MERLAPGAAQHPHGRFRGRAGDGPAHVDASGSARRDPGSRHRARCAGSPGAEKRRRARPQRCSRGGAAHIPTLASPPGASPPGRSRRPGPIPESSDRLDAVAPANLERETKDRHGAGVRGRRDALVGRGAHVDARGAWPGVRALSGVPPQARRWPQHVLRRKPDRARHLRCGAHGERSVSWREHVRGAAGAARAAADRGCAVCERTRSGERSQPGPCRTPRAFRSPRSAWRRCARMWRGSKPELG